MQIISIIEQHIGNDPATGRRMIQYHEVITEVAVNEAAAARIGDLHAVEVELATLDAVPRSKAEAWLAEHADQIDASNKAAWTKRAIEAFTECARCRVQASGDNVMRWINQGWRHVNLHDRTAGLGLQWVCADCWQLFVRKDARTAEGHEVP